VSVRAALDAARAVFDYAMGSPPVEATNRPVWSALDASLSTQPARAHAMWQSAERVLQAAVGRAELTGQALIGEARRAQVLSLGDAHALIALQGWTDRLRDRATPHDAKVGDATTDAVHAPPAAASETEPTDEHERSVARAAWLALENVVDRPGSRGDASTYAAPSDASRASVGAPAEWATPSRAPAPPNTSSERAGFEPLYEERRRPWYSRSGVILASLFVVVLASVGGFLWYRHTQQQAFEDGLAAYQRGAREVARMAFARAAQDNPDDARPLVFLGRLAREENDLARARRFLEQAVSLDPTSATAQRELASALLADGQPELARRFYVRAVELDPTDRLAQGFLGCALFRLGRFDEARRWATRAGPGDWMPCLSAPPVPITPPVPPSMPPR